MHNIRYSNLALIDLEDAIYHIAKESKTNALAYLSKYEEKIELLKLNPFMGVECKSKLIKKECRILVHESHIIIYKVDMNINEIFIIRIYHSSVDYTNKFNRE
jgi:plasmid stabilization system protein ParE